MKYLALAVLLAFSTAGFAQIEEQTAKGSPHNVSGLLGFGGGTKFGAMYEYMYDQSAGIGGQLRVFPKNEDDNRQGYTIFGAFLGHHFFKRSWDLSFSPGFAIINVDDVGRNPDDETVFGPSLGVGILHQITDTIAFGFDHHIYWAWFDDDYGGVSINDFSLKLRASF